jgi:hypothetical protein
MIQPFKINVITRSYLLMIMARGAAAFGANCQRGYDMIYPFLYETHDFILENVGFIIVQVKNYAGHLKPQHKAHERPLPGQWILFCATCSIKTTAQNLLFRSFGLCLPLVEKSHLSSIWYTRRLTWVR